MKKVLISARIKPEDAEWLIDRAYSHDISVSTLVRIILEDWIKKEKGGDINDIQ